MLVYRKFLFLGGYDEIIKIYDLKTQKEVGQLEGHEGIIKCLKNYDFYTSNEKKMKKKKKRKKTKKTKKT